MYWNDVARGVHNWESGFHQTTPQVFHVLLMALPQLASFITLQHLNNKELI